MEVGETEDGNTIFGDDKGGGCVRLKDDLARLKAYRNVQGRIAGGLITNGEYSDVLKAP